jgi:hypothetical protein
MPATIGMALQATSSLDIDRLDVQPTQAAMNARASMKQMPPRPMRRPGKDKAGEVL